TVTGAVPVTATATSTAGITSVQFSLDGTPLGSAVTSTPYSISWDTTLSMNGLHTLTASTTDGNDNIATSSAINVTVANPPVFSTVSASGITTNGATISWAVNVPATATVEYGTDMSYGSSVDDTNLTTSGSVTLSGLLAN